MAGDREKVIGLLSREAVIKLYIEDAVEYSFLSTILTNILIFEFAL